MPAGLALALRSNIPDPARFAFSGVDEDFYDRATAIRERGGHLIVGGANYGQGSSREHGALVPAYLRLRAVIAKAFARIHGQNLVNFGVAPLLFCDLSEHDGIEQVDVLRIQGLRKGLERGEHTYTVRNLTRHATFEVRHDVSDRQVRVLLAGGLINDFRARAAAGQIAERGVATEP
jgi:aconitase A